MPASKPGKIKRAALQPHALVMVTRTRSGRDNTLARPVCPTLRGPVPNHMGKVGASSGVVRQSSFDSLPSLLPRRSCWASWPPGQRSDRLPMVALVTLISAFEPFYNWRSRWMLIKETQYRLNQIRDEMDYYVMTIPAAVLDPHILHGPAGHLERRQSPVDRLSQTRPVTTRRWTGTGCQCSIIGPSASDHTCTRPHW
jgi:hypothetical protein